MKIITQVKRHNSGFTLIELAIAISVFSLAILTAFSLAISNQRLAAENYDRVLAANLAREGIELVRNVRDSNWLSIDANQDCNPGIPGLQLCAWDDYISTKIFTIENTDPIGIFDLSSCVNLETCLSICSASVSPGTCRMFIDNTTDTYGHDFGGFRTNMNRLIQADYICLQDAGGGTVDPAQPDVIVPVDSGCSFGDPVGLKVTVLMSWDRFNKNHTTEVVEYLYNWR